MVLGVLAVMSVSLADAYFVGKLGEIELAAISFIFPVTTALTSLGIGLSAGSNAVVSQALGAGRTREAHRAAAHAIVLGGGLGVLVSIAGYFAIDPLFTLLQAQDNVLPSIREYLQVWYYGFPLLTLLLITNALMRAHGGAIAPASLMILNAIINIGLNPVLIFGWGPVPALGIAGAATATLIAFAITTLASLWPVFRSYDILDPHHFLASGYTASIRGIGEVGAPAAFANAINPAGLAAITAIVAGFGPATVAGFGAAGRIESIAMVPLLGLSGSIGAIIGQNWGAQKYGRASRALQLAVAFCLVYGLAVAALLNVAAETIAAQFSDKPAVHEQTVLYLRIVAWTFFAYGVLIVTNACLNARSRAFASMALSITRIGVLYVPLAWFGGQVLEQAGVYTGAAIANVVAAAAAIALAARLGLWQWRPAAPG